MRAYFLSAMLIVLLSMAGTGALATTGKTLDAVSVHYDEAAQGFANLTTFLTSLTPLKDSLDALREEHEQIGMLREQYVNNRTEANYLAYQEGLSQFFVNAHTWYTSFLERKPEFIQAWETQAHAVQGLQSSFEAMNQEYQTEDQLLETEIAELTSLIKAYAERDRNSLTADDLNRIRIADMTRASKQELQKLIHHNTELCGNTDQILQTVQARLSSLQNELLLSFTNVSLSLPTLYHQAHQAILNIQTMKIRTAIQQYIPTFTQLIQDLTNLTFDAISSVNPFDDLSLPEAPTNLTGRDANVILDEAKGI